RAESGDDVLVRGGLAREPGRTEADQNQGWLGGRQGRGARGDRAAPYRTSGRLPPPSGRIEFSLARDELSVRRLPDVPHVDTAHAGEPSDRSGMEAPQPVLVIGVEEDCRG